MGLNSTFQINVFCKIFGKAGREGSVHVVIG